MSYSLVCIFSIAWFRCWRSIQRRNCPNTQLSSLSHLPCQSTLCHRWYMKWQYSFHSVKVSSVGKSCQRLFHSILRGIGCSILLGAGTFGHRIWYMSSYQHRSSIMPHNPGTWTLQCWVFRKFFMGNLWYSCYCTKSKVWHISDSLTLRCTLGTGQCISSMLNCLMKGKSSQDRLTYNL